MNRPQTPVINASHWHQMIHQNYILYAPHPLILEYLKKQLIHNPGLCCEKIPFQEVHTAFACLIINTLTNEYYLTRDHFGLEPFYYAFSQNQPKELCFGSSLPDLLAHLPNPQFNEQQISNVLMNICISSLEYTDQTFYDGIFRVTPGHILQVQFIPYFIQQTHPFWTLTPGTSLIQYPSDADYDAHFASLLQEAIQVTCQTSPTTLALEFSGGLDTATLLTALHTQGYHPSLIPSN